MVTTFKVNRELPFGLAFYLHQRVAAYEGLEVSPHYYNLPARVPREAHIVVTKESAAADLDLLLPGRTKTLIGYYRPQHLEIYSVSAAE